MGKQLHKGDSRPEDMQTCDFRRTGRNPRATRIDRFFVLDEGPCRLTSIVEGIGRY